MRLARLETAFLMASCGQLDDHDQDGEVQQVETECGPGLSPAAIAVEEEETA